MNHFDVANGHDAFNHRKKLQLPFFSHFFLVVKPRPITTIKAAIAKMTPRALPSPINMPIDIIAAVAINAYKTNTHLMFLMLIPPIYNGYL